MINYRTRNGKAADDFINWIANLATSEEGSDLRHDSEAAAYDDLEVLDRIIRRARGLTTASGPLGELLKEKG